MNPVTVKTSAGPVRIATELGNPAAPVHVVLGQGLMSVSLFLTREQALNIGRALREAIVASSPDRIDCGEDMGMFP